MDSNVLHSNGLKKRKVFYTLRENKKYLYFIPLKQLTHLLQEFYSRVKCLWKIYNDGYNDAMTGPTSSQRAQLKYPVTFSERWSQMELKRTLQQC